MRQIAIYGKGGIGKSMVSSHITFALAAKGLAGAACRAATPSMTARACF